MKITVSNEFIIKEIVSKADNFVFAKKRELFAPKQMFFHIIPQPIITKFVCYCSKQAISTFVLLCIFCFNLKLTKP